MISFKRNFNDKRIYLNEFLYNIFKIYPKNLIKLFKIKYTFEYFSNSKSYPKILFKEFITA